MKHTLLLIIAISISFFSARATVAAIAGTPTVCIGATRSLTDATPGGTWSSSNTAVGTVNSSGVVRGITAGTTMISYIVAGDYATKIVTVNGPTPMAGIAIKTGTAYTLSNDSAGGTWTSGNTAVAPVGASSGIVTGIATGTPKITYTLSSGCTATLNVSVSASTISYTPFCVNMKLTPTTAANSGGVWYTSGHNTSIDSVTGETTALSIGSDTITYTVVVNTYTVTVTNNVSVAIQPTLYRGPSILCKGSIGVMHSKVPGNWSTGSSFISIDPYTDPNDDNPAVRVTGATVGTAVLTFSKTTGFTCYTTRTIEIRDTIPKGYLTSKKGMHVCRPNVDTLAAHDSTSAIITGGNWISPDTALINIIDSATGGFTSILPGTVTVQYIKPEGCIWGTYTVNVSPAASHGNQKLCIGSSSLFTNDVPGGAWSSNDGNLTVDTSGVVTAVGPGNGSVVYTMPTGCNSVTRVTVNPVPAAIGGTKVVCVGQTTALTESSTGGKWRSSDSSIASVDSTTGVVTGVSGGMATISYVFTSTGCFKTAIVTVNPVPAAIAGTLSLCLGQTTVLTNAASGGTWRSSDSMVATVNSSTGLVTALTAGTTTISYTMTTGCGTATAIVTVNPVPAAITGTLVVCEGATTALANATGGGTWSSANTAVATVVAGVVNGISGGTANITYMLPEGCFVTATVTVNPAPAAITGTLVVCVGATTALANATEGGTWSSGNMSVATVAAGVVTGVSEGTATITYMLSTGCFVTATVTVNPAPAAITGTLVVCVGATTALANATEGGTWNSGNMSVATVAAGVVTGVSEGTATITYMLSTGCFVTATVTVNPVPAAITGTLVVCAGATTALANATEGGTWSSGNTYVATVAAGVVTGVSAGTAIVTYMLPAGCFVTATVTVNPAPAAITGTLVVCVGATTALANATEGGTWSSGNTSVATVAAGVITGVSEGTATITYMLSTGCLVTAVVTVNPAPSAISGSMALACIGTTALGATPPGGTWSSGNTAVATVDASSGVVTSLSPGTTVISYTISGGCYTTAIVTVSAPVISGTDTICAGSSATLTGMPSGGTWSSSAPAVITVGASSGVYAGIAVGTATITYSESAGCRSVKTVTAKNCPVGICETYPIATCDSIISYCDSLTLSASNASAADTFTWSPAVYPVQSVSGSDIIFTFTAVPTSGVYTLTVASPGGYHRTATVRIVVAPGGCYPCTAFKPSCTCVGCGVVAFKTITSTTLNSTNISTSTPGNYFIVNSANISGAPAAGSVFYMAKGVRLTVDSTDSVVLSGCHFFSPSCYWKGITVNFKSTSTGKITVNNNTLIEDAIGNLMDSSIGGINGYSGNVPHLPISGGYIIRSNNAIFNHNLIGIRLQEDSSMTTLPFEITGTIFTNRNFCGYHIASPSAATDYYPFRWPSADYLKTPVSGGNPDNPDFKIDSFTANTINDSTGRFGIRNVLVGKTAGSSTPYTYSTMVIGDNADSAHTNLFDTLGTGIYGYWSNLEIYNNIFRRTQLLGAAVGNGIVLNTSYTNKVKIAAGTVAHTNNVFYNCTYAVNANGNGCRYFECTDAVMKFNYTSISTATPAGIDIVQVAPLERHYISGNTISNAQVGIKDWLTRYTSCTEGDVTITHNDLTGYLPATTTTIENAHYGITIAEPSPADCSSSTGTLRIDSNSISGFATGIGITGTSFTATGRQGVLNTNIDANTIVLKTNSTVMRYGINVFAMKFIAAVDRNLVYGDTTHGVKFNTPSTAYADGELNGYTGIRLAQIRNGAGNVEVSCNFVHDMNIGFKFFGTNSATWTRNMMMRNKYGVVMNTFVFGSTYNGQIGTQGATCSPADNVWYDDGTAAASWPGWLGSTVRQTYMVGANATGSTLYVRANPTDTAFRYTPTNNGGMNRDAITYVAYASGTSIINAATGCGTSLDAPDSTCALNAGDVAARVGADHNAGEGLADADNRYTLYPNPGNGNLMIAQNLQVNAITNVKVMNNAGVLVYQGNIEFKNGTAGLKIDVGPGVYLVVLTDGAGKLSTYRLVIQK